MSRSLLHPRAILSLATLTAALLGTACSDSTAPSDGDGSAGAPPITEVLGGKAESRIPTSPADGQASSDVLSPTGADTNAGTQISALVSATGSYTKALCHTVSGKRMVIAQTQAGVPFYVTGSGSTQRVWFRANFYKQVPGSAATYLGSGEWFYADLKPGQRTSTRWYRYSTGMAGSWQSQMEVFPLYSTVFYANLEYHWSQGGTWVAKQSTRATHIFTPANTGTGGKSCFWPGSPIQ